MSWLYFPNLFVPRDNAMQRRLSKTGEHREAFPNTLRPAPKINLIFFADVNQVSGAPLQSLDD
jgi:hypothetical protein